MITAELPRKILVFLQEQPGREFTLVQISEMTGTKITTLRTEMTKWLTKYPEEFAQVHRQNDGNGVTYSWRGEKAVRAEKPKRGRPPGSFTVRKQDIFCKVIDKDGDDVILKDDQGRLIKGRYMK